VRLVYTLTAVFPQEEKFGITAQMRRAAVSIISNIAEGYGRGSRQDYARFLRMARGSLFELEAQGVVAVDLEFLTVEGAKELSKAIDQAARPLSGLINAIK
jgi:four helix bundle protein